MDVEDLVGKTWVENDDALLDRLRTVRKGDYGAFILSRDACGPSLWIHINGQRAYLHFFADSLGEHPGFQSTSSTGDNGDVHFLQTDGGEADSIDMPSSLVIEVNLAYAAALEFLRQPSMPQAITWFEL